MLTPLLLITLICVILQSSVYQSFAQNTPPNCLVDVQAYSYTPSGDEYKNAAAYRVFNFPSIMSQGSAFTIGLPTTSSSCGAYQSNVDRWQSTPTSCNSIEDDDWLINGLYTTYDGTNLSVEGAFRLTGTIACTGKQVCTSECENDKGVTLCYTCTNYDETSQDLMDTVVEAFNEIIDDEDWDKVIVLLYDMALSLERLEIQFEGYCTSDWHLHPACYKNYLRDIFNMGYTHGGETYNVDVDSLKDIFSLDEWVNAPEEYKSLMFAVLTAKNIVGLLERENRYMELNSILPSYFPEETSPVHPYLDQWMTYIKNADSASFESDFDNLNVSRSLCQSSTDRTLACSIVDAGERYQQTKHLLEEYSRTGIVRISDFTESRSFDVLDDRARDFFAVDSIMDKIEEQSAAISQYFVSLAEFDNSIATADVGYLNGAIDANSRRLIASSEKIEDMISDLQQDSSQCRVLNIVESTLTMALGVAGGVTGAGSGVVGFKGLSDDIKASTHLKNFEIASTALAVAVSTSGDLSADIESIVGNEADTTELISNAGNVAGKLSTLAAKLRQNAASIANMEAVVDAVLNEDGINSVTEAAELFLTSYSDYSPAITQTDLVDLSSKYNAMLDSMETTFEDSGILCSLAFSTAAAKVREARAVWEIIESLLGDIYDQQFQLIDALVSVVRSKLDISAGLSIADNVDYSIEQAIWYMMNLRTAAHEICNVFQYLQNDVRSSLCQEVDSVLLMTDTQRDNIASIDAQLRTIVPDSSYYTERDVYIPVSSVDAENSVNWNDLMEGKLVTFRLPEENPDFVENNKWTGTPGTISLIRSIEIFLPGVYDSTLSSRRVELSVKAIENNVVVNANTGATRYSVKVDEAVRTTFSYIDNYAFSSCPSNYMGNVYCSSASDIRGYCLDSGNGEIGDIFVDSLPVSMYSTFQIQLIQGASDIEPLSLPPYDETLKLRARIQAFTNPGGSRFRSLKSTQDTGNTPSCCADGYFYDVSDVENEGCKSCPDDSLPTHHGTYCTVA